MVEAIFLWLCASKGKTVAAAVADLPVDLDVLSAARAAFGHSGAYRGDTAVSRQSRFHEQLDTSSTVALARMPERKHFIDDGTEPWSGTLYAKLYASVVHTKGLPAFLQGSRSRRPSEMWAYSPYWSDVAEQVSAWGARKTVLVPALPRTGPFPPRRELFVRNGPIGGAGNAAHIAYPPRVA